MPIEDFSLENDGDGISADIISKYAQQPMDLKEGLQSAVKSLQRNLSSAAQTILAVPMEVYERSGNEVITNIIYVTGDLLKLLPRDLCVQWYELFRLQC